MQRYKLFNSLIIPSRIAVGIGILMLGSAALVPFLLPFLLPFLIVAIVFFLGFIIVRVVFRGDPKHQFQKQFKEDFLPWLIQQYFPGFLFSSGDTFELEELNQSLLFGTKLSTRKGEDMVSSQAAPYALRFSEVTLSQRKASLGEFAGEKVDEIVYGLRGTPAHLVDDPNLMVKVFEGVVCQVILPHVYQGSLIVRTRGKGWSALYRAFYQQGRVQVATGDATFDALFEVFVSEAHQELVSDWLTPTFRTHMVQVQSDKAQPLAFALFENQLYWAIQMQTDMLEAQLYQSLPDHEAVQVYVDQVERVRNAAVGWLQIEDSIQPDKS